MKKKIPKKHLKPQLQYPFFFHKQTYYPILMNSGAGKPAPFFLNHYRIERITLLFFHSWGWCGAMIVRALHLFVSRPAFQVQCNLERHRPSIKNSSMNNRFARFLWLVLPLTMLMGSCQEDVEDSPLYHFTQLNIRLTDAPVAFDEVNIDLQQVVIKGPGGTEVIGLNTNAGVYNLLEYQGGLDTVIADAVVPLDDVRQIRLVLGEDNTVVVNGEEYELKIPSAMQSGIKINLCLGLAATSAYDLLLDFDAGASIHQTGNGKFIMHPVIRVMNDDANCGGDDDIDIDGLPDDAQQYLEDNYSGYALDPSRATLCGGDEVYLVAASDGNMDIYLYFGQDGAFLQSAIWIEEADLPAGVQAAINGSYPAYDEVAEAYQVTRANGDTWYDTRLEGPGVDGLTVIFDDQGNVLCEE